MREAEQKMGSTFWRVKMKTLYFKKTVDSAEKEWVDSQDIFQYVDEGSAFFNKWYLFITKWCDILNYYNMNTSTAHGNPDLSNMQGFCSGYLAALGCYYWESNEVCYIKDRRDKIIIKFDVPKISETERENRKKIDEFWENV